MLLQQQSAALETGVAGLGRLITPAWYAVRTRSRFEKRIAFEAGLKDFDVYLPLARAVHKWKDRRKIVETPVFSCYVFLRFADYEPVRLRVLRIPGVVGILGGPRGPEAIPDQQIEAVRRMVETSPCSVHPLLREGAPVRVVRGPLEGIEGLFLRAKSACRLVVSLPLLSQSIVAEIDAGDVEPLPEPRTRASWRAA